MRNLRNLKNYFIFLIKINYHLIIRPHPSDPIKEWESTVKNFKNISCSYSGEVNKHILAAKKYSCWLLYINFRSNE